ARVRQAPGLLRGAVGVRAAHVRPRDGRRRACDRGIHAGFLPPRAGRLSRGHLHEADARDAQEPQAPEAARALPGRERQAVLQARRRATCRPPARRPGLVTAGETYLTAGQLLLRARELGAEITRD